MILLPMLLSLTLEPPTDARSCAIRYRAIEAMFSYAIDSPAMLATSKRYGARLVTVLVKAGEMKDGEVLPAAISEAGSAYARDWRDGKITDKQVAAEVEACDKAHGYGG